ncbi:MAG: hypothetical protein HKO61_09250 [Flavobacteriaceae bacterium]|nr:hypothetical protein [Flavobacteriaceae bacterium]
MKVWFILILISGYGLSAQVGINTTNPQQALHISGSSETVRIESLNSTNNSYNGGDVNGDLDLTNDTFPLYVDENGNFTLELKTYVSSEDLDAFDDTALPTSAVELLSTNGAGEISTTIKTYSITVTRASILEVKYSLSFDVYLNSSKTVITDNLARLIETHIEVTGQTRHYGPSNKCYTSGTLNSVTGTMFNSNTAYITLPSAGSYDISFIGRVLSDVKGGGPGDPAQQTYVEFATGNDFVFMRLH